MWISKRKYHQLINLRKEIEYMTVLLQEIRHDISKLKMGSNKPPMKNN
jgi:hypothetical protein